MKSYLDLVAHVLENGTRNKPCYTGRTSLHQLCGDGLDGVERHDVHGDLVDQGRRPSGLPSFTYGVRIQSTVTLSVR